MAFADHLLGWDGQNLRRLCAPRYRVSLLIFMLNRRRFQKPAQEKTPRDYSRGESQSLSPDNTSDDEVGGRGQLVHTGLDRAHVFPSMLQLDVPDHQVPGGILLMREWPP